MSVAPSAASPTPTATQVGLATAACCVGLAVWNPGDHGVPFCPTKALTGLDCPFCGGLRAVAQLTRGHLPSAADHNIVVVALAPVAVVMWALWWWAERTGRPAPRLRLPRAGWVAFVALLVVFTVVRNLPVGGVAHWLNSSVS